MTLTDDLRATFLAGSLEEAQLADLVVAGEEVTIPAGEEVFREGQSADFMWILLVGKIELSRQTIVLATMSTPGQWAGGLRAWADGNTAVGYTATARAAADCRVFRLPSPELSRLVGEWFPFGKHLITGVFQTVRVIEAAARQRESLVALGTLAAGLAHEINNPAAASLRAVEALRQACNEILASLSGLAETEVTAKQLDELDTLRRQLGGVSTADMSAVAVMDREEIVGRWLDRKGMDHPWQAAPVLASAGADQTWLEEIERVVGPAALLPALHWTASTVNVSTLLDELTDATTRVSQLVGAVRSYSELDRAPIRRIDIHEGLDNTLTMLAVKLHDIEVDRQFGVDVPELDAYPAELNQVWTNLIDNAIDAMDGHGSLSIETSVDDHYVIVDITDSGHGIDPAVQSRLFEPFFTTKDVGKGTGLGLDISRRIVVDRHGGEITFESKPRQTTARVRLPLKN